MYHGHKNRARLYLFVLLLLIVCSVLLSHFRLGDYRSNLVQSSISRVAFRWDATAYADSLARIKQADSFPKNTSTEIKFMDAGAAREKTHDLVTIPRLPTLNLENSTYKGNIFVCGYHDGLDRTPFYYEIFPDYNIVDTDTLKELVNKEDFQGNTHDVFISNGYNPKPRCKGVWHGGKAVFREWISQFRGKVLAQNPESWGVWRKAGDTSQWRNVYQIGHYSDSNRDRTMRVYFAAISLLGFGPVYWKKLFDHEQKPRGTKRRFMIYAASNCVDTREQAADALSEIDVIDRGGKCWGLHKKDPSRFRPAAPFSESIWLSNKELFSDYRFCLVMENTVKEGYITEKIVNAFLAGCIPIYHGTREVLDLFNEKAFIFYDTNNPENTVQQIRDLEADPLAYDAMLAEPVLANGQDTINEYFSLSDKVGDGSLKRRIRKMMGIAEYSGTEADS